MPQMPAIAQPGPAESAAIPAAPQIALPLLRTCMHGSRPLSGPERTMAEAAVKALDGYLRPVNRPDWLAGRIMTLLSHGYIPDIDGPLDDAVTADWMHVLSDQPQWAIQKACLDWLAEPGPEGRRKPRPQPADIRQRCYELTGAAVSDRSALIRALRRGQTVREVPDSDTRKRVGEKLGELVRAMRGDEKAADRLGVEPLSAPAARARKSFTPEPDEAFWQRFEELKNGGKP